MNIKRCILCVLIVFSLVAAAETSFEMARDAYKKGAYGLARAFFINVLRNESANPDIPDALYYLTKIAEKENEFTRYVYYSNRLMNEYSHDARCGEVFTTMLRTLADQKAFVLAYRYIEQFDYLDVDTTILQTLGYGLVKQHMTVLAERMLAKCPQSDTVKILRACITEDTLLKLSLYRSIETARGKIHLAEFYLDTGDTLTAYEIFRSVRQNDVKDDELYRYAKIATLFSDKNFYEAVGRMSGMRDYKTLSVLLRAVHQARLDDAVTFTGPEECSLYAAYLNLDTVSRAPIDSVDIVSPVADSLEDSLLTLRKMYPNTYYLDSTYAGFLLGRGKIDEAYKTVEPYADYANVVQYVRALRGLKHYAEGKYKEAALDILLSRSQSYSFRLLLAHSFSRLDRDAGFLYESILSGTRDTFLICAASRSLTGLRFKDGDYNGVIALDVNALESDTGCLRMYAYSLARTGKLSRADSLMTQLFGGADRVLVNYYGEYLIEQKKYKKARVLYDSIVSTGESPPTSRAYYNWALVPLLQGQTDTARVRFSRLIQKSADNEDYYKALFKYATLYYVENKFDSAAHYYGLASKDDSLRIDALRNQLICYKKGAGWLEAVETGEKLLDYVSGEDRAEIHFEIGYAHLRLGRTKGAVRYLKEASDAVSSPEYLFWLAEAYLAKADFVRALYQYKRITALFPRDEMWTPTAEYKVGIVLEFMDEIDEAKRHYREIIRKRGAGDTWGVEAQRRLDVLE